MGYFNLSEKEELNFRKHYKKQDIIDAENFVKSHNREDFKNFYVNHTNKEIENNYDVSLEVLRAIRILYNITEVSLRENHRCKDDKSSKEKIAYNKGKKMYNNGISVIYLSDNEEVPDGYVKGSIRKNFVAYHNSDNKVKYFSSDDIIPDGWLIGEPKGLVDKYTNSHKSQLDNIHKFEIENNCTLQNTVRHTYANGWYGNIEFKSSIPIIKNGGRNFIPNDQLDKIANYSGNAKETANRHIEEFEKENNCTLLQKLCEQYGQLMIFSSLPRITSPSGGRIYISNEYIPQIIKYKEEVEPKQSRQEKELLEYIKSIYNGSIEGNVKTIIKNRDTNYGQELDIYLKDLNIAIEYNGVYWHSSQCDTPKDYHQNKSLMCEDLGIRLIHIYQDEWLYKQDKIKQLLNIALGNIKNKIYARNCEVREISNKEAQPFSDKTHLQGHRKASVTYGLFYNDELVQLMSFSKTSNAKANGAEWEIIRGCPGSNNIVIGGVSKLFTHFVRDYSPKSIFSYCDFNKFDGKSYESLGMKFIGYTGPDKYWVIDGKLVPRNPNKYKELKEKSQGILWGSGSKKYLWINESLGDD